MGMGRAMQLQITECWIVNVGQLKLRAGISSTAETLGFVSGYRFTAYEKTHKTLRRLYPAPCPYSPCIAVEKWPFSGALAPVPFLYAKTAVRSSRRASKPSSTDHNALAAVSAAANAFSADFGFALTRFSNCVRQTFA